MMQHQRFYSMKVIYTPIFIVLVSLSLLCYYNIDTVQCKIDRNQPHGHRGKLQPYIPGPFIGLQLTNDDEKTLDSGSSVMKQTVPQDNDASNGGTAICIQDVHAPISAVWYQILHMEEYPKKVNKVLTCQNYVVHEQDDQTIRIKTKQVLGVLPGYSYESYYDHTFYPEKSSLTWNLDYDKTSDMEDVVGHWHVMVHPKKGPTHSRVYYACDIQMKGHVPKPIFNYISKAALKQATSWVKRESELHPNLTVEQQLGGNRIPIPILSTSSSSESSDTISTGTNEKSTTTSSRRGWFSRK